jgi:hypothetical protein
MARSVATPGIVNAGMAASIKNKPKVNDINSMTSDSNERLAFAENGEKGAKAEAQATPVKAEGGNWLSNSKIGKGIQKVLKPMQNQDDLEGYKNNPNYDQELANAVRMGEANKNEASVQTTADAANQARQQKEEQNELRRQQREAARNQQPAAQPEQPDNSPEALATAHGRIVAGKATDDDLREDFENFKNKSDVYADGRTPGPKTMNEWKRLGLVDENGNIVENEAEAEPEANAEPQPEPQPEANAETPPAETEANAEPTEPTTQEPAAPTAMDGAPEETKTPEQQEKTEEIKQELQASPEEQRKAMYDKIFQELNPDEKGKWTNIFQAYKDNKIDKAQRDYFIADALARWGKNMGNIMHANQTNAMWANIKSGNQINPDIDIGPNEWQKYLKEDWAAAQKMKNEAKQKALTDTLDRTNDILKEMDAADLMYNIEPRIYASSWMGKKTPEEIAQFVMVKGYIDGNIRNMNDAANVADYFGNLDITGKKGLEELRSMYLDNEGKVSLNEVSKVQAKHAETKAGLEEAQQRLMNQLTQGEIDMQTYEKESKALDNQIKNIDKQQKQIDKDLSEKLAEYKIEGAKLENMQKKYGSFKFKLNAKIPMLGEMGGEVDGATLANVVGDIDKLIRDNIVSKIQ